MPDAISSTATPPPPQTTQPPPSAAPTGTDENTEQVQRVEAQTSSEQVHRAPESADEALGTNVNTSA